MSSRWSHDGRIAVQRHTSFHRFAEPLEPRQLMTGSHGGSDGGHDGHDFDWGEWLAHFKVPAITVGNATVVEGSDGARLQFPVTLSEALRRNVTVDYMTIDGTAVAGADYQATSGRLTIVKGTTSGMIEVPVLNDDVDEADETVVLKLKNACYAWIKTSQAMGTIVDDDQAPAPTPPPTVSVEDASAEEGEDLVFVIKLSRATDVPVTVQFQAWDRSAEEGPDYEGGAGTVTIPAGATEAVLHIATLNDLSEETDETFQLELSNPTNATVEDGSAVGTIHDATPPPPEPAPTPAVTVTTGGDGAELGAVAGSFIITRSSATDQPLTVRYKLAGNAKAGKDFLAMEGVAVIPAGETSVTVTVTPIDDRKREGDETVVMRLVDDGSYDLGEEDTATMVIADHKVRPPRAVLKTTVGLEKTSGMYLFRIVFTDEMGLDVGTLSKIRVKVTGPGGYEKRAQIVDVTPAKNNRYVRMTLGIPRGPKGWMAKHNGRYVVHIMNEVVTDLIGNKLRLGRLGRFDLDANDVIHEKPKVGALVLFGDERITALPELPA